MQAMKLILTIVAVGIIAMLVTFACTTETPTPVVQTVEVKS